MPVLIQISFGSIVLLACSAIHIWMIGRLVGYLQGKRHRAHSAKAQSVFRLTSAVFLALLVSHTVQIYVWAGALSLLGALPGYESPIYFSLVSYTTLGYGDVTLADQHRIFGAMSSVNGILCFGISTAFLVGFFSRILTGNTGD